MVKRQHNRFGNLSSLFRSWTREETGATAVEFAIIGAAFVLLLLGIFEITRALWIVNSLQYAAERGSRYAVVHPDAESLDVQDVALDALRSLGAPSEGVSVMLDQAGYHADQPAFMIVRVTLPFSPVLLPLGTLLWSDASLSAVSQRAVFPEED